MSKQAKKTKFGRGKQIWSDEHEALLRQLLVNGVINPKDIKKSSISWIFEDPKYPIYHNFSDKEKWPIFQRNLKRLSTVYLSEIAASGDRVSPSSKFIL